MSQVSCYTKTSGKAFIFNFNSSKFNILRVFILDKKGANSYEMSFNNVALNKVVTYLSSYSLGQYPTLKERVLCLASCNMIFECKFVILDQSKGCLLFNQVITFWKMKKKILLNNLIWFTKINFNMITVRKNFAVKKKFIKLLKKKV